MKKNVAVIGIIILVFAVAIWMKGHDGKEQAAGTNVQSATSAPKPGYLAPSFELASLDGKSNFRVGGERDKLLIVNFWAAWCGPCEQEAPDLKAIYEKHKDRLDLFAVNATKYDKLREAKDFVKEQGFVFPVLTDVSGEAEDLYKVFSFPTSFIIDRDGVIVRRIEGVISREQWENYLEDAMKS
jgi:cytochrome c biogenesis protein CcmG, thiol:disulfide interchange protein DsbE